MKLFHILLIYLIIVVSCKTADLNNNSKIFIFGGEEPSSDHPGAWNTVGIVGKDQKPFCSGTLIGPNLVLTAAHCLVGESKNNLKIIFSYVGDTDKTIMLPVSSGKVLTSKIQNFPSFDMAWLVFSGDLPPGYRPIQIIEQSNAAKILKKGITVHIAGYGKTGNKGSVDGKKRTVEITLDDFLDDARHPGLLKIGPAEGKGVCHGDSGGPVYVKDQDTWRLAGITSVRRRTNLFEEENCENGLMTAFYPGNFLGWLRSTSQVDIPGASVATEDINAIFASFEESLPKTFEAWCQDMDLPAPSLQTMESLLYIAQEQSNCTSAATKLANYTKIFNDLDPTMPEGEGEPLEIPLPISDLRPLAQLGLQNRLVTLMVKNSKLADLSPLAGFSRLSNLSVSGNNLVLADLSIIGVLPDLTSVDLSDNGINDLSSLANAQNLRQLYLNNNRIADLSPLSAMTKVFEMSLANNEINDLTPIASLSSLQLLAVSGNKISLLPHLDKLTNLRMIDLSSNQLTDVATLSDLPKCYGAKLTGNPLPAPDKFVCPLKIEGAVCDFGNEN